MSENNPQEKRLIQLRVNGVAYQQQAETRWLLSDFLVIRCISLEPMWAVSMVCVELARLSSMAHRFAPV